MSGKFGSGAPKCVECNKSVYKAEEQQHEGKIFHRLCFSIWTKKEAEKDAAKRNEQFVFCFLLVGRSLWLFVVFLLYTILTVTFSLACCSIGVLATPRRLVRTCGDF
jgi:hypothetical protein